MIKSFFSQRPKALTVSIYAAAILVLLTPLRTSYSLITHYFELQNRIQVSSIKEIVRKPEDFKFFQSDDFTKRIFQGISQSCGQHQVIIKQIELPILQKIDDVEILSQQVTLIGGFTDVLKSINQLRDSIEPIKITSLQFQLEEENKIKSLTGRVVFQSPKISNYE